MSKSFQTSIPVLILKRCLCGCGVIFSPKKTGQKYFNKRHRDRAYARRYRKKHNVHKKYQGTIRCPKCGKIGQLFFLIRDNAVVMSKIVEHRKSVYSKTKRKELRKKGLTSKEICNKNVKIKKHVRDCYL